MNYPENNSMPPIPPKQSKLNRTVWVKFMRTIAWIGFWLLIAWGALALLFSVILAGAVGLLVGVLCAGLAVLGAFLLCSRTFIKLDMADDVRAIREMLEKR